MPWQHHASQMRSALALGATCKLKSVNSPVAPIMIAKRAGHARWELARRILTLSRTNLCWLTGPLLRWLTGPRPRQQLSEKLSRQRLSEKLSARTTRSALEFGNALCFVVAALGHDQR